MSACLAMFAAAWLSDCGVEVGIARAGSVPMTEAFPYMPRPATEGPDGPDEEVNFAAERGQNPHLLDDVEVDLLLGRQVVLAIASCVWTCRTASRSFTPYHQRRRQGAVNRDGRVR